MLLIALAAADEPPLAIPLDPPPAPVHVVRQAATAEVAAKTLLVVRGLNLAPIELAAASAMIRKRFDASFALFEPAPASLDDLAIVAMCRALACRGAITADLMRVDREILVSVSRLAADGRAIRQIEATAGDLDALIPLFGRIATAITHDKPLRNPEQPASRAVATRIGPATRRLTGARTGLYVSEAALGMDVSGALVYRWGSDRTFYEWDLGFVWPAEARENAFRRVHSDFGTGYFLTEGDNALYAGGGAGGCIGGYDRWGLGVGGYGMAGVLFRTDKPVTVYLQTRGGLDLFPDGDGGVYAGLHAGVELGFGY